MVCALHMNHPPRWMENSLSSKRCCEPNVETSRPSHRFPSARAVRRQRKAEKSVVRKSWTIVPKRTKLWPCIITKIKPLLLEIHLCNLTIQVLGQKCLSDISTLYFCKVDTSSTHPVTAGLIYLLYYEKDGDQLTIPHFPKRLSTWCPNILNRQKPNQLWGITPLKLGSNLRV